MKITDKLWLVTGGGSSGPCVYYQKDETSSS